MICDDRKVGVGVKSDTIKVEPACRQAGIIDMFLPNTYSFLLIRRPIVEPSFTPETGNVVASIPESTDSINSPQADSEESKVNDQGKRTFLKVATIAGAGIIASQLSPKKAQALIMGSSPTTGVVGVKNASNTRINPATEETVSSLLKPSDLTFDTGSLQVKVTSVSGAGSSSFSDSEDVAKSGLVDADRHVQVDVLSSELPSSASTETTLQTISFGRQFALRLATVGEVDYVGEAVVGTASSATGWRIKKIDSTTGIIITWADGTAGLDKIWDSRASYTYS